MPNDDVIGTGTREQLTSILATSVGIDSTTLQDTGLSIQLLPNTSYYIRCGSFITGSGDTIKLQLTYSGTLTPSTQTFLQFPSTNVLDVMSINAAYSTGSSEDWPQFWGVIRTATGGILKLQMCKVVDISGDDLVMSNGGHLVARRI